ncbi:MAG: hypothetical protein RIQ89_2322 [Bacteroidota bacterium]|jgi:hypothetical protein
MKNLSLLNKAFIIFCAALIVAIALTVPPANEKSEKKNSQYVEVDEN